MTGKAGSARGYDAIGDIAFGPAFYGAANKGNIIRLDHSGRQTMARTNDPIFKSIAGFIVFKRSGV